MMEDLELLDNYLDGTLSEAEQRDVEARLVQDNQLQQKLEELRTIRDGIASASRRQIVAELKVLEQTLPEIGPRIIPLWQRPWLQVAAAAMIATVAYVVWPAQVSEQDLFTEYFEPYPNVVMPTVRGSMENDSTTKAEAYRAYDRGAYSEAISLFEAVDTKDEGTLLYLGNSYLANGQPQAALPVLEKVLTDYDVFDEQAEWYIAICYLKLESSDKARKAFITVVRRSGFYQLKAKRILENLN